MVVSSTAHGRAAMVPGLLLVCCWECERNALAAVLVEEGHSVRAVNADVPGHWEIGPAALADATLKALRRIAGLAIKLDEPEAVGLHLVDAAPPRGDRNLVVDGVELDPGRKPTSKIGEALHRSLLRCRHAARRQSR